MSSNWKRGIWRVEKPKKWQPPTSKSIEAPSIVMPDGRDAKCAVGQHLYSGMKMMPPYERAPGEWYERYYPVCPKCGAIKQDDEGKPLMFDGKRVRPNVGEIRLED